jgi:predicted nucleic acid-binding protein
MENKVVSNTGPILHLSEIKLSKALEIFQKILIPEEVSNELKKHKAFLPKIVSIKPLSAESKDKTKAFANEYDLDLGESQAIALALQEKADYFITDDLDAREVAKRLNLEVHGTIGIILRAFREKLIERKEAISKIKELQTSSTLYITNDLIESIIGEIENFKMPS